MAIGAKETIDPGFSNNLGYQRLLVKNKYLTRAAAARIRTMMRRRPSRPIPNIIPPPTM
jgi:hypothetical protein